MSNEFNVIQIGLGPMGKLITKLLLKRKNIILKGVIDINPQLVGEKLSKFYDLEDHPDLIIKKNLKEILSEEKIDVVIVATSSSLEKVSPIIKQAINSGISIISICEELSYPFQQHPKLSEELDALAKSNKVTIVGTGINPGYLMDLLPIIITAPCQDVRSIKVTRMMDSAKRRES
ncbi:MAG: Gfo/Idh/MocA family oxidoreductase, partial [Candidatus Lokiarchaeota archaeon]|nr:Gfo/Idh/MocA family oxidoreductase [Candidatus Lokiarchaeota archaeon]